MFVCGLIISSWQLQSEGDIPVISASDCSILLQGWIYLFLFSVLPRDEGTGEGAGGADPSYEVSDQQVHQEEREFSAVK